MNKKDYKEIAKILKALKVVTRPNESVKNCCFIISMKLADYFEKQNEFDFVGNKLPDGMVTSPDSVGYFNKIQFLKWCGVE